MADADPVALLGAVPLFAGLEPRRLALLAGHLRHRRFRRGEVLFHAGDPAGALHLIQTGSVKVSAPTAQGAEPLLALLGPGSCVGEFAALDGSPRSATVTAVEPTETLALPREALWAVLRAQPDVAERLILTLAARLRRINSWLEDAYFTDLDTRLARRLLELAETQGQQEEQGIVVLFPLTQAELAAMLGATRASVNALLGVYQDAGLLRLGKGRFTVLQPTALRRRAGIE